MNPADQSAKGTDRAQAQRERILDAAEKCFIEHGFHAASMALLAETAKMSPGLIYRYFSGKSAIILAIVERQLENTRTVIRALHNASDFEAGAFETFNLWRNADPNTMNVALFLEMTAEATRDPNLAAALHVSDLEVRKELRSWLTASVEEGGKGLPAEVADLRVMSLQCFMEGLAIRALREPDLPPADLKAMIAHSMSNMFSK